MAETSGALSVPKTSGGRANVCVGQALASCEA